MAREAKKNKINIVFHLNDKNEIIIIFQNKYVKTNIR
jgi:hypothetical protein